MQSISISTILKLLTNKFNFNIKILEIYAIYSISKSTFLNCLIEIKNQYQDLYLVKIIFNFKINIQSWCQISWNFNFEFNINIKTWFMVYAINININNLEIAYKKLNISIKNLEMINSRYSISKYENWFFQKKSISI